MLAAFQSDRGVALLVVGHMIQTKKEQKIMSIVS